MCCHSAEDQDEIICEHLYYFFSYISTVVVWGDKVVLHCVAFSLQWVDAQKCPDVQRVPCATARGRLDIVPSCSYSGRSFVNSSPLCFKQIIIGAQLAINNGHVLGVSLAKVFFNMLLSWWYLPLFLLGPCTRFQEMEMHNQKCV